MISRATDLQGTQNLTQPVMPNRMCLVKLIGVTVEVRWASVSPAGGFVWMERLVICFGRVDWHPFSGVATVKKRPLSTASAGARENG